MNSGSDDEYTPTDDEVETHFHEYAAHLEATEPGTYPFRTWEEALRGYRRWVAAHDAEVAARAWDEGVRDANRAWEQLWDSTTPDEERFLVINPYRKEAFDETNI